MTMGTVRRVTAWMIGIMAMVAGLSGAIPGAQAAQSGPPPTVGQIVVDGYDCESGRLDFRVDVADLPHVPDPDLYDEPLVHRFLSRYERGPIVNPLGDVFNPPAQSAPFTGTVPLAITVPPSNDRVDTDDPFGPIVSIELTVSVGYAVAIDVPTDTSTTIIPVDCGGGSLVDRLIAILVAILRSILRG